MKDEHKKFIKGAKDWLKMYAEEIEPHIKNNFLYSPGDVSRMCAESGMLTFYLLTFQLYEDELTEKERELWGRLEAVSEEMIEILEANEDDFDEYCESLNLQLENLGVRVEEGDAPEDMETIIVDDNSDLLS